MPITTYTELQAAIADWLNRVDLEQQIPDFIALAESTLNRVLRDSRMATTATITLTTGSGPIPTDAVEMLYVQSGSVTSAPLEQITPQQLVMLRRARLRNTGTPRFFAVVGRNMLVAPIPTTGTLSTTYYQKIPSLSTGSPTNWLLTEAPHVYLYSSLVHAAPFLKDDARVSLMQNIVSQQIVDAVKGDQALTLEGLRVPGISLNSPSDIPLQQGM